MPDFKVENLDLIEATGLWPNYPYLVMKQWDEVRSCYIPGILKDVNGGMGFDWWPGDDLRTFMGVKPMSISKIEVERLIENGWMVDS